MNPKHAEIINRVFGENLLKFNEVPNYGCIVFDLSHYDPIDGCHTDPEALKLEELELHSLKDNEAILARIYNGKGYVQALHGIVPGKNFVVTRDEWNEQVNKTINKPMLPPREEMLEEFDRRLRLSESNPEGFNAEAFEQFFTSMEAMFEITEGCKDEIIWKAIYYAYNAGQWSRETHATEKMTARTIAGLGHASQQYGRTPRSKNKLSEWEKEVLKIWKIDPNIYKLDLANKLVKSGHANKDGDNYKLKGGSGKSITLNSFGDALTRLKKK